MLRAPAPSLIPSALLTDQADGGGPHWYEAGMEGRDAAQGQKKKRLPCSGGGSGGEVRQDGEERQQEEQAEKEEPRLTTKRSQLWNGGGCGDSCRRERKRAAVSAVQDDEAKAADGRGAGVAMMGNTVAVEGALVRRRCCLGGRWAADSFRRGPPERRLERLARVFVVGGRRASVASGG